MDLYIKYRPDSFESMIGNDEIIESLKNKILTKEENRPHVFLFNGNPGTGKTTTARICAKMLKADKLCIHEINSSENRGIDTARQIIEQMRNLPISGESTVFIIDELHQTTKDFQNAMLKPLEDTPDHVYFFLCTTDPQKLLSALKSRCVSYTFSSLSPKQLYKLIYKINREEGNNVDSEIMNLISENVQGCPRNAITMYEKIVGLSLEEAKNIIKLGIDAEHPGNKLAYMLLNGKSSWQEITKQISELEEDIEKVRWMILGYMRAVLIKGNQNEKAASIIYNFKEPFYSSGEAGFILACYDCYFGK